jgi:hypothetical protein
MLLSRPTLSRETVYLTASIREGRTVRGASWFVSGWTALSFGAAALVGRIAVLAWPMEAKMEHVNRDTSLDRLVEIALSEIPRVRAALGAWVDDGLLVAEMRGLENEARALRTSLEIDHVRNSVVTELSPGVNLVPS